MKKKIERFKKGAEEFFDYAEKGPKGKVSGKKALNFGRPGGVKKKFKSEGLRF
jgi:FMN-dependent NADH-azoreductase